MWINKFKDKKYVGSSVNLRRRLLEYYNVNILFAYLLLKHGYQNFNLTIFVV